MIHSRDAHEATVAILSEWAAARERPSGAPLGVIHCFSGDAALARRYAGLGFAISFAGPVTYPKNDVLRDAAAAVPSGWIVVETDCPYLSPQSRRGRRNEPAQVAETSACIAALRGQTPSAFAAETSETARRVFGLAAPAS